MLQDVLQFGEVVHHLSPYTANNAVKDQHGQIHYLKIMQNLDLVCSLALSQLREKLEMLANRSY